MARLLVIFFLSFGALAQEYYEEPPLDDQYDAYDQPQELMKTKEANSFPPPADDNYYDDPPENFDAPAPPQDIEPYPADEPYPEDPYPVNEEPEYQDNY